MQTHVIIGAGEVGQALQEVLSPAYDVHLRDIEPSGPSDCDVIHIAFPWSANFSRYVQQYRTQYKDPLTIVHSSVPVGTCDDMIVVHSPIRGQHPQLAEGIRTFVKFFGGFRAEEASLIFERLGIRTWVTPKASSTEAGKLWELTQYGLNIAIEKAIHEYCEANNVPFDLVYTMFAESYNEGYTQLGHSEYVRPVLKHVPGPIGGHCVAPGASMLAHDLSDLVIEAGIKEAAVV